MNKNRINEHEHTKKMMDIIRYGLLAEQDEGSDVISPSQTDEVYAQEVKSMMDAVDPRIQITKFKIYPNERNVQFEGRLDSGINFFMSTKAMKLSISITDDQGQTMKIFLDDDLLSTIQKLKGYYENWVREWGEKLNTEYKPTNNENS